MEMLTFLLFLLLVAGLAFHFWWRGRLRRNLLRLQHLLDELNPGGAPHSARREGGSGLWTVQHQLEALVEAIRQDYAASKQFSQNAAHELQTPLAAIKNNVELLLQSPHLSEVDAAALAVILQHTNRLARLNQSLILLSRIEHRRFADETTVDIPALTEVLLRNFQDLIEAQQLTVSRGYESPLTVDMSAALAEALVANLIQNAVRHNRKGGFLAVQVRPGALVITNSGAPLAIAPELLFRRFYRASDAEEGLGLGLSIVQQICERYGFEVKYEHEAGRHRVTVRFN